ncbi:hypothetical protein PMAYCL1PPCAC_17561, partial [Pristionchus mayeri]
SELRSLAYYGYLFAGDEKGATIVSHLYHTIGPKTPSLRRVSWAGAVRNEGQFAQMMQLLTEETEKANPDADARFGTRRDHLVYALCADRDRLKTETLLSILIKEPQFTARDVVMGFTAMVRDFDDCHDGARFIFTVGH